MTDTQASRAPLTRARVLEAAVDLADREGLDALTMRRLGAELEVEAMSLYKHVANKEAILAGIVETVIAQIEVPSENEGWRDAMRRRAHSAREVMSRHAWAVGLLESGREMGPAHRRYLDAILGSLRSAGFSVELAAHAFWLLDAFVYGHVVQEANLSHGRPEAEADVDADHPHLAEVTAAARTSAFSYDAEFDFGLELILDGLDDARAREAD